MSDALPASKPYDRETAKEIREGHVLALDPRYNERQAPINRLRAPITVLEVGYGGHCESGVLLKCRDGGGKFIVLDAGWFINIPNKQNK